MRNCLRVGGWWFLYAMAFAVGAVCCVVPGLYLLVAGALTVPMVIFRAGGLGESIRTVNRNFGAVLGRLASVVGVGIGVSVVGYVISVALGWSSGATTLTSADSTALVYPPLSAGYITGIVVESLFALVPWTLALVGATLTYFEMRNRQYPTSTAQLATML